MTTLPAGGRRGRTRHPRGGRRLLLLPLVAFAAPALVAFVYIGYVLWPRWPGPPVDADAPPLPIIVGGVAFNLPPAAIRVPVQRRPGVQERVDLAYLCPSLAPPDPDAKSTPPAPGAEAAPVSAVERVFVTISRAGDTLPPTERAREIYPRYTAAAAVSGPDGLAVLAFRAGTPYQGGPAFSHAAPATAPGRHGASASTSAASTAPTCWCASRATGCPTGAWWRTVSTG